MKKIFLFLFLLTAIHANGDKLALVLKNKTHNVNKIDNHLKYSEKKVIKTAKKYLGRRYKFGKFDCSKFTQLVFEKAKGKHIPRTAYLQASSGIHIDKKNLRPGDLVFFAGTSNHSPISHVGIYLGYGKFIHASSGAGKVTISNLNKHYYKKHYFGSRRI